MIPVAAVPALEPPPPRDLVASALSDQPFEQTTALPPPPVPGGDLTPEQLALAAVPPQAPGGAPLDQALAEIPPSTLPPPPAAPPPKTPGEAAQQNLAAAKALGEETVANATERTDVERQQANQRAAEAADREKRLAEFQARQETHRQAAAAAVTDARAAAENQPYHTLWETRTTGQKVAIAIGSILGGISWNANHVNRGVEMLKEAMANDLTLQRDKHAELWKAVESAERGERALDERQLREVSAFSAAEGAKNDAVAARLNAMAQASKGKGDVTAAKKLALEYAEKGTAAWTTAEQAAATASHVGEMDRERAAHDRAMEQAAKDRALAVAKKKGAGGGGGGTAQNDAYARLLALAEERKAAGKPMTKGELTTLGISKEYKLPPLAKAGRPSIDKVWESIGKETKADADAAKLEHTIGEKDANLILYDPQTKLPYGKAHNAREVTKLSQQDVQYGDAARRVQELADDIRDHGSVVKSPEDIQRRAARYANAIIGVAVVSPLGKTNESIHQEAASIGLPGAIDPQHLVSSIAQSLSGFTARIENVNHKVHEMKRLREEFRHTVPISDEDKRKYSGGTGPKIPEGFKPTGRVTKQGDPVYISPDGKQVVL